MFASVLVFVPLGMSVSLVAAPIVAPMIALAELNENRTPRQQGEEELSGEVRVHRDRHTVVEFPHCSPIVLQAASRNFNWPQPGATTSVTGHRLAHDLLAPMTC
jgi:hypothetical protein